MEKYLPYAVIALALMPAAALLQAPFFQLYTPKQKRTWHISCAVLGVLNFLVMCTLGDVTNINSVYLKVDKLLFGLALTLVQVVMIPRFWRDHLFVYGLVATCIHTLYAGPTFVVQLFYQMQTPQDQTLAIGIFGVLFLLLSFPLGKFLQKVVTPFLTLSESGYWNNIWMIPVGMFAAMFVISPVRDRLDSISQLTSRVLLCVVTFLICRAICEDHVRLRERQEMTKQLETQKDHYAHLRGSVEEARRARHDLKHHFAAIQHYIDTDDKSGLQSFCDELMTRAATQSRIPYTGNPAADGVLYHYVPQALDMGIRFEHAGVLRCPRVADVDLCALLGNALENAFTACRDVPKSPFVSLKAVTQNGFLSIIIQNSYAGEILEKDSVILSQKRDYSRGGYGLPSIRDICQKNGGSFRYDYEDGVFCMSILLPAGER